MKCKAIKGNGKQCPAMALEREELCGYHSFSEASKKLKEEGEKAGKGTKSTGISRR